MTRISEKFASLRFTSLTLIVLVFWFLWGLWLSGQERYAREFEMMNDLVGRQWLLSHHSESLLLKFWFIGLCIIMAFLGVNLILCTWNKIFKIIKVRFDGPRFYMLIVHVFFGVVALGHFGGLMLGFEYNRVKLFKGKQYNLAEGYQVRVENVHFVDDPAVLNKSRRERTKKDFHYRENYADVLLSLRGEPRHRGTVSILHPFTYRDIQITLMNFIPPSRGEAMDGNPPIPGVVFTISRNPVLSFFLIVYPMMIIGIFVYLLMTWKRSKS